MGLFDWVRSALKKSEPPPAQTPGVSPVPALAPASAPPVDLQQPRDRRQRQRINARPGTRALIIDDSPTIVAVFRKTLGSVGFEVMDALTAEEGLEIARAQRPDLIFLDIVLPGMNGFAALRHMRKDPQTSQIPIIMISGNEQATEQFYAERIGADDFMKKPFSRYEIFARIEHLLDADCCPRSKRSSRPVSVVPGPQQAA